MGNDGSPLAWPPRRSAFNGTTMGDIKNWYNKLGDKNKVIETAINSMNHINNIFVNYNYIKSVYWLYCLAKDDTAVNP